MRKLGRIVLRVVTAVSLLLYVAVLGAWVRGFNRTDSVWLFRETLDATAWRRMGLHVTWTRGDIILVSEADFVDARQAQAAAVSQGTGWNYGFENWVSERGDWWHRELVWLLQKTGGPPWSWDHLDVQAWQMNGRAPVRSHDERILRDAYRVCHSFAFPCWMAAIVFGALPSWRFLAWWRGRRRLLFAAREGRCRGCGYDLRASPLRCPECGLAVKEKREARSEEREDGEHRTLNIEHPTSK